MRLKEACRLTCSADLQGLAWTSAQHRQSSLQSCRRRLLLFDRQRTGPTGMASACLSTCTSWCPVEHRMTKGTLPSSALMMQKEHCLSWQLEAWLAQQYIEVMSACDCVLQPAS